jgi:metal-responsive CopG/Arc/MetJ family transcriptional regulator
MRIKTSVTLDKALLEQIDAKSSNRSAFIEDLLKSHFKKLAKAERDARDIEIINKNADWLNEEAKDVLEYQELFFEELDSKDLDGEKAA